MHECGFSKRRHRHEIGHCSSSHNSHLLDVDLLSTHGPHHRRPFHNGQSGRIHHTLLYARTVQSPGKGCAVIQATPLRSDEKETPAMAAPQPLASCRPAGAPGHERVLACPDRHTPSRPENAPAYDYPVVSPTQSPTNSPVVTTLPRRALSLPHPEQTYRSRGKDRLTDRHIPEGVALVRPLNAMRRPGDTQKRKEVMTTMLSWKLMKATERACRNMCEEEEAAFHYNYQLSHFDRLILWIKGFIAGWPQEEEYKPLFGNIIRLWRRKQR